MAEFCEECDGHHEPMPHNPLLCGCVAKAIVAPNVLGTRMENHHVHVVHCPMHAAAERMAKFISKIADHVSKDYADGRDARAILRDIAG